MDLKEQEAFGLTRAKRAGIFVNVVLIVLLGGLLAFLLVHGVQRLSWSVPLRFDWTADQRYAIDPLSRQLLEGTEDEIQITAVFGYDAGLIQRTLDPYQRPRGELLERYYRPILAVTLARVAAVCREWERHSPRVKIKLLWQPDEPAEVARLALAEGRTPEDLLNRIRISQGRRFREIFLPRLIPDVHWGSFAGLPEDRGIPPTAPRTFRVHEELGGALQSLLAGELQTIGLVTEVGGPYEPVRPDRFEVLKTILLQSGFELKALPATQLSRVPDEVQAVMLLAPETPLPEGASRALIDYEARAGGRLLLVPSALSMTPIAELIEPYGIQLTEGLVSDQRLSNPMREVAHSLESDRFYRGSHPIVSGLAQSGIRCFLGYCRPLVIVPDKAPGVQRELLLAAERSSRILPVRSGSDGSVEIAAERFARAVTEPPALGFALSRPSALSGKDARVVIFSGQGLIQSEELMVAAIFANRDLVLNGLRWITEREQTIGILPRDAVRERLVDVRALEAPTTWIGIILLPGLAIALGLLIGWSRR